MKTLGYVYLYVTCTADEYADIQRKEKLHLVSLYNEVMEYASLHVLLHPGTDDTQLCEAARKQIVGLNNYSHLYTKNGKLMDMGKTFLDNIVCAPIVQRSHMCDTYIDILTTQACLPVEEYDKKLLSSHFFVTHWSIYPQKKIQWMQ